LKYLPLKAYLAFRSYENAAGAVYDAPSDLLVGWGGDTRSILQPFDDFGISARELWLLDFMAPPSPL